MKFFGTYSCISFVLLALFACTTEGFVFNSENPNFLWDVNRCSNINPIVDSKTIILTANGKWSEDKFCTAIRRDLKVTDEKPYEISTEFNNIAGFPVTYGHLGFMFNVWDDYNYDFVYKRYVRFIYGRIMNNVTNTFINTAV